MVTEGRAGSPAVSLLRSIGALLQRIPRRAAWVPVLIWVGCIAWLGSRPPGGQEPGLLGSLPANLAHAPLYGLLALWAVLLVPRSPAPGRWPVVRWPLVDGRAVGGVLALVLSCAVLDELHQAFGGRGRDGSVLDILTDLVGAACVLAVIAYLGRVGATGPGLWSRLGAGVLACLVAASLATWGGEWLGAAAWL